MSHDYDVATSSSNHDEEELASCERLAKRYLAGDKSVISLFESEIYELITSHGVDARIFAKMIVGDWYDAVLDLRRTLAPVKE